ncbi:50S ribosomal protein L36 [Candidatus Vidania fulgoroideorum]
MKVNTSVKKKCSFCKIVKRKKTIYILCVYGKHKQRQG